MRWRWLTWRAEAGLRLPADGCTGRVGGGDGECTPSGLAGHQAIAIVVILVNSFQNELRLGLTTR